MKPGSVIVDIAAGKGPDGKGGNCPLTVADQTVVEHGVTIVGETNLAGPGRRRRLVALRAQRARLPQARGEQGRHLQRADGRRHRRRLPDDAGRRGQAQMKPRGCRQAACAHGRRAAFARVAAAHRRTVERSVVMLRAKLHRATRHRRPTCTTDGVQLRRLDGPTSLEGGRHARVRAHRASTSCNNGEPISASREVHAGAAGVRRHSLHSTAALRGPGARDTADHLRLRGRARRADARRAQAEGSCAARRATHSIAAGSRQLDHQRGPRWTSSPPPSST